MADRRGAENSSLEEDVLVRNLIRARDEVYVAQAKMRDIQEQLALLRADYPTEEGWYLDADHHAVELRFDDNGQPYFHDGWETVLGEDGIPLPTFPLKRLVPVD